MAARVPVSSLWDPYCFHIIPARIYRARLNFAHSRGIPGAPSPPGYIRAPGRRARFLFRRRARSRAAKSRRRRAHRAIKTIKGRRGHKSAARLEKALFAYRPVCPRRGAATLPRDAVCLGPLLEALMPGITGADFWWLFLVDWYVMFVFSAFDWTIR